MLSGEQGPIRALASLGGLAFVLGVLAIAGWLLGQYLDRLLGTAPWLSLVGSLLGVAAGLFEVITIVRRAEGEGSDERKE